MTGNAGNVSWPEIRRYVTDRARAVGMTLEEMLAAGRDDLLVDAELRDLYLIWGAALGDQMRTAPAA